MAIDQTTNERAIDDLTPHLGHKIELVSYGAGGSNASVECVTCSEVLIDFDLSKDDDERAARLSEAGGEVVTALTKLYEIAEDEGAVGEMLYEIEKAARRNANV